MAILKINGVVIEESHDPKTPLDAVQAFVINLYGEDAEFEIELTREERLGELSKTIYARYSLEKQTQDEKWVSAYSTKLKAAGVENLERTIVGVVANLESKSTQDSAREFVSGIPEPVIARIQGKNKAERKAYAERMFTKLVKIAARTQWAEACVQEGSLSISESREPNFPAFPEL